MIDDATAAKIRRFYFGEHFKIGTICAQFGLHHDVVERVINVDALASRGIARPSALDPYVDFMRETLERYPKLTGTRLHEMLRLRGYKGSAIQVRRKIRKLHLRPKVREAFFRLDTLPGEQGQCDWGHFGTIRVGGTERKLFALVIVLSWSRAIHCYFSLDQTLPSVIRGHRAAFEAFGGVPRTILYDNMKTVVLERDGDAIRFHPRFLQLSAHYLFAAHPCGVARGNEKGKVERAIRYLRDSFFAGRHFADLEDVRSQFLSWRDTIAHVRKCPTNTDLTVADALTEERGKLLMLPIHPFDDADTRPVVAEKQPYVIVDTNRYSIPWEHVAKPLTLSTTEHEVRILDGLDLIATHKRSWEREQVITVSHHLEGLSDYKRKAQSLSGRALVLEAVPRAEVLYQELLSRNESLGPQTRRLLELLEEYGPQRVASAIEQAIERKSPRADSVAYILERDSSRKTSPRLVPRFESAGATGLSIQNHRLEDYDDL